MNKIITGKVFTGKIEDLSEKGFLFDLFHTYAFIPNLEKGKMLSIDLENKTIEYYGVYLDDYIKGLYK